MPIYQLKRQQVLAANTDRVWAFVSNPANLSKITPPHMDFRIVSPDLPPSIYPGLMIEYRVRPLLGIPLPWLTEITQVQPQTMFVDEQRVGPYALWHHEHWLEPCPEGTRMTDIITYQPPLGWLGAVANAVLIGKQLEGIFAYRAQVLPSFFAE